MTYLLILILLNYFTLAPLLQQNHSLHLKLGRLFSFDDGVMIEAGYESKVHSVVEVARAFPCFFHATSCGFEFV